MLRLRKLISADGLTKYEPESDAHRDRVVHRLLMPLRPVAENFVPDRPVEICERVYQIWETYFDVERGCLVDVYKEKI